MPRRRQSFDPFTPTKAFIAVLIVAIIFFLPIIAPGDEQRNSFTENYPALNPLASSADACPFRCIRCIEYDPDSWPRDCLTWECLEDDECGSDPGGGGGRTVTAHHYSESQLLEQRKQRLVHRRIVA